jgi:hypothetical protein
MINLIKPSVEDVHHILVRYWNNHGICPGCSEFSAELGQIVDAYNANTNNTDETLDAVFDQLLELMAGYRDPDLKFVESVFEENRMLEDVTKKIGLWPWPDDEDEQQGEAVG